MIHIFLVFLVIGGWMSHADALTFKEVCSEPYKTTYGVKGCYGFDNESEIYYDGTSLGGAVCAADPFLSTHVNGMNNTVNNAATTLGNVIAIQETLTDTGLTCVYPKLDFSRKYSGNASIKFTTGSGSGSGAAGDVFQVFQRSGTPGNYTFGWYGPGSDFWFRVALFDSNEIVTNKYSLTSGTGGTKRFIIHAVISSGRLQTVLQDTDQIELVQAYGGPLKPPYQQQQNTIGCGPIASLDPDDFPKPPCRPWQPGKWVVYHVHHILADPVTQTNSIVEIYIDDEEDPIILEDEGNANYSDLSNQGVAAGWTTGNNYGSGNEPEGGFGKFSLTNFHTGKQSGVAHTPASAWYDDVIISDQRIPALSQTATTTSVLKAAADTMVAGEWKTIETVGLDAAIDDLGTDSTILSDMSQAHYDPINKAVYIIGGDHNQCGGCTDQYPIFTTYDEMTNTWTREFMSTEDAWGDENQHTYDELWLDTVNQRFGFSTRAVCAWPCAGKTQEDFTTLPTTGIVFSSRGNIAYEYFPGVGLMRLANFNIRKLADGGSTWQLVDTLATDPQLEPFMEYNPIHKEVVLGGGTNSNALFVVDQSETKTQIADCPGNSGQCHVGTALLNTDANGDYIFVACNGDVHKYVHNTNAWTNLGNQALFFTTGATCKISNTIGINIPKYRVIMYVKFRLGGDSEVFLYKHSNPAPPKPARPFQWWNPFSWF